MKTIIRLTMLACAIFLLMTALPLPKGAAADYNPITKRIRCFDARGCLHEIGHKTDHEQGWISKSDAWAEAVQEYMNTVGGVSLQNGIREMIMLAPDTDTWRTADKRGGHLELYANILMYSEGDKNQMPAQFVDFYDWQRIWELQELFDGKLDM